MEKKKYQKVHIVLEYDLDAGTLQCKNCGEVRLVRKNGRPTCGVAVRTQGGTGKRTPAFRRKTSKGYIELRLGSKVVLEHRHVMSQMLGRDLLPGENVHHKNGIKTDNDPDNLELWVTSQPSGQRPEDLVQWAVDIIERYGAPYGVRTAQVGQ